MVYVSNLEIISGISIIFATLFTFILGGLMIRKYFQNKERTILLMSITMIFVGQPWWPYGISVILILTTGEYLPIQLHVLIGHILQPLAIILWMFVISELLWKKRQRLITIITAIFSAIYETVVLYTIFIDPSRFVIEDSPLDYRFLSLFVLVQLISLIMVIITGIMFFLESRKSTQPDTRLKGKLFIIAVLSYAVAAIVDSALPLTLIMLFIVRILLVSSSIEIYGAFVMPKWMEKLFLKKKSKSASEALIEEEEGVSHFLHLLKTKPKEITEEEVTFYREQTICLVCKSLLVKYNFTYFCQSCRALYCAKCARAISKIDNACWACNAPVDESKPVKLFKKDEEPSHIKVSEEPRKK